MYCRFCGNKLDEDAVFCPKCGQKIKIKNRKKKKVTHLFLLLSAALFCTSVCGIHQYRKTDNYIINTQCKKTAEQFKRGFEELETATDVRYIVAEFDGASYVKAVGKWNGEEHTLVGIREKGKWRNTSTQGEELVDRQMSEDLAYMVEEKMQVKADRIVVYDEEFQVLDVLKPGEG